MRSLGSVCVLTMAVVMAWSATAPSAADVTFLENAIGSACPCQTTESGTCDTADGASEDCDKEYEDCIGDDDGSCTKKTYCTIWTNCKSHAGGTCD